MSKLKSERTAWDCLECGTRYEIKLGEFIRCPDCGSKERDEASEIRTICKPKPKEADLRAEAAEAQRDVLLEALKPMVQAMVDYEMAVDDSMMQAARAAIAEAEGGGK